MIPFALAFVLWSLAAVSAVDALWVSIFPFLAEPPGYGFGAIFESQETLERLVGAWWFFGLLILGIVLGLA